MANLPLMLSLTDDLNRVSLANLPFYESPFYCLRRHPAFLALSNEADQTQQLISCDKQPISSIGKDGFQVCMDVQQFKPSELSIKVVDNSVVVE